jgi:hypothetical protein
MCICQPPRFHQHAHGHKGRHAAHLAHPHHPCPLPFDVQAMQEQDAEMLEVLLQGGANPSQPNKDVTRWDPAQHAFRGHPSC